MYLVLWESTAFDQMQAILLWHPDRRTELASTLQKLASELRAHADIWGESRDGSDRLGFLDHLSVLIDEVAQTVTVVAVQFQDRRPPSS